MPVSLHSYEDKSASVQAERDCKSLPLHVLSLACMAAA